MDTLSPTEALKEIDGEQFPKLYATTERLAKAEELSSNYKIRAEKAEAESKELKAKAEVEPSKKPEETPTPTKETETPTPKNDYSLQDIRALSKVHDDDVERVTKFAKGEGVSVAEVMKDKDLKAILKNRNEERKTAKATSTGKGKRGTSKVSIKSIKDKANKYEDLESDEDYDALVDSRLKQSR